MQQKKVSHIETLTRRINLPKALCEHLIGDKHTVRHRMCAGIIVMGIGIIVAKVGSGVYFIGYILEGTGNLIHAIGAIPILERLEKMFGDRDINEV